MVIERDKRLLSGMMSGVAVRAISMIAPLFTVPATLLYLGDRTYGLWMTVVSITSMALFADFGVGNGLMTKLAQCKGNRTWEEARILISNGYALVALSGAMLLVILLTLLAIDLMWWGYWTAGAKGSDVAVGIVCVVAFVIGMPLGLIQRIQYADQKVALSNAWGLAAAAGSVAMVFGGISLQLPSWGLVAAVSMVTPAVYAIATIFYFYSSPHLRPSPSLVCGRQVRRLLEIGMPYLFLTILTSIAFNVDSVIVAATDGVEGVAALSIAAKIVSVLAMVVNMICLPLWPANGEAIARGEYGWVIRTTWRMSALSGIAIATVGVVVVSYIDSLTTIWLGRVFNDQRALLAFLCSTAVLTAIASPFFMVMNSVGEVRLQIIGYMVFLVLSIALKTNYAYSMGVVGVAMAGAVTYGLIVVPTAIAGYLAVTRKWVVVTSHTGRT